MENISCILCGEPSNHVVITENGYNGLKCDRCNLIYISPRPDIKEITALYAEHHALEYADAQYMFERHGKREASKALSIIRSLRDNGSVLELGPGGGAFLQGARDLGYEPFGIELNPIEACWINDKLHIPCESEALSKSSFGGRKFDIVYHKDVLSHLRDPIGMFLAINQALNDSGLHVFETGNIADVKERHFRWFTEFHYPDHLFFFGENSLISLLSRTGFRYIRIYRNPILLPLILQKALWNLKNSLKDQKTIEELSSQKEPHAVGGRQLSLKRRLRLSYRYIYYYLTKFGSVLPKKGWPLKLLVIAEKEAVLRGRL